MSGKTATLNCRVNPDAKQQAENPITIPKTRSYEADSMSTSEIHAAIQEGIDDAESGRVKDAASVFAKFRESHS